MDGRVEKLLENEGVIHDVISENLEYPCDPFIPDYGILDDETVWADLKARGGEDSYSADGLFRIRSDATDDQLSFYLSSLIASCEYSSRGVCITSLIIKSNPANYTAWAYRMDCAERLELPLADEMDFARRITFESPKSYQAWQYRRRLCELHNGRYTEVDYIKYEITSSPKNHCAWSHLTWLMIHFPVTKEDALKEMEFVEFLLSTDVYNNTAWVYKTFLFEHLGHLWDRSADVRSYVVDFKKLLESPWNESLANYLIHMGTTLSEKHKECLHLESCEDDCAGGIYVCSSRAINKAGIITTPLMLLKSHMPCDSDHFAKDTLKLNDPLRF